ncbi:MAG: IclR family transcriptional regulator C-terminal domain-containing protein, partial [Haliea sp.]
RFTPATITEASAMKDEIAKIQDRGFAIDNGENVEEVRCVAAPLRNISGKVFGAISVSSAWDRMPDRRIAGIAEIVRRTADGISISLGWRNNAD